jgi:hypothetical protein
MKTILPIALLLAMGATQTAPAAIAPAAPQVPTPRKIPGVSDAGNAILAQQQTTPDPQLAAIVRQQRALRDQLSAAAMAPTPDVDKVAALLKEGDDLQSQFRTHSNERLINALRALPEADRGPFLRALVTAKR